MIAFGESVTAACVLAIAFVPLFFPNIPFLAMAPMILGVLEVVAHTAAIRMFRLDRPCSPGLATVVFLLLPISLCGIIYAERLDLMSGLSWLLPFVYIVGTLMLAQQFVVKASGMKYSEFLGQVRATLSSDA